MRLAKKQVFQSRSNTRIALVQTRSVHDPVCNWVKAFQKIQTAAKRGAQIICLQELFATDYFPQTKNRRFLKWAEPISSPRVRQACVLAKSLGCVLILPVFERARDGYYNSALVIETNGTIRAHYRKMHVPNDPNFYERYYFSKGNKGVKAIRTSFGTIGVLICWDQWFPEPARMLAAQGAQIIFYPTAIGSHDSQRSPEVRKEKDAWITIQRSHAIANGIFVASVNRIGREGKLHFWGGSFVSDPFGEVIARAVSNEKILFADCDFSKINRIRNVWPFLKERRFRVS